LHSRPHNPPPRCSSVYWKIGKWWSREDNFLWKVVWCMFEQYKNYFFMCLFKNICLTKRNRTNLFNSSLELTRVDFGQCKDKNDYYHSFKTWLRSWLGARLGWQVELTIDSSQHKDKIGYYWYTCVALQRLSSWVGIVGNGMGGRNIEFLSFISKKEGMRVVT